MRRRISVLLLVWFLALALSSPAVASIPGCAVPDYDCTSELDGHFTSPMDVPALVPNIFAVCKRDADIYRVCATHASARYRETILVRLADTDAVVAAALLRLHRENEAHSYEHEAYTLATRLLNNAHLTDDERVTVRFIASREPMFPIKNAFDRFLDDAGFVVAFYVFVYWPVFLALIVFAVALLAPRRAM